MVKHSGQYEPVEGGWAGGAVRVLLAKGFQTPLKVRVSRRDQFVCRTEFRNLVIEERSGDRYVFTFPGGQRSASAVPIQLQSDRDAVVLDTIDHV